MSEGLTHERAMRNETKMKVAFGIYPKVKKKKNDIQLMLKVSCTFFRDQDGNTNLYAGILNNIAKYNVLITNLIQKIWDM